MAVSRYAHARFALHARRVIHRLQRIRATGVYGDDYRHRTLWDEYCHEIQNGPYELLEEDWGKTVSPIMFSVAQSVPDHEARLLSLAASWESDDEMVLAGNGDIAISRDLIAKAIEQQVRDEAAARDLSRFDPT